MAFDAEIKGLKVEKLNAVELTDDVLQAEIAQVLPLDELQGLEKESFLSEVDTRLEKLQIEYTEENGVEKEMAVVIGDKRYTIVSPKSFEGKVEKVLTTYIATLEGLQADKEKLFLSSIDEVVVELVKTTEATNELKDEVLATNTAQIERIKQQKTPTIQQLSQGTKLDQVVSAYADKEELDPTLVYERIQHTQREILSRFFSDIPNSEVYMDSIVTATSLHLFDVYTTKGMGSNAMRESVFASADELQIGENEDNFFGKIKDRAGGLDIQALFQVSGMMQFFMVFKDADVKASLSQVVTNKGFVKNYYLANPYQMQLLMKEYAGQKPAERAAWLEKKLLAASVAPGKQPSTKDLEKYEITTVNTEAMTKIIDNYGGNAGEFENFMHYVEQGETVLGQVDTIKQSVLENPQAAEIIKTIAMIQETMVTLGTMLGFDEEDMAMFNFFDGVLGWLGFDGVKGYLEEHAAEEHLGPLLAGYKTVEKTPEAEVATPTAYGTLLTSLTDNSRMQDKIVNAGGKLDVYALYDVLRGENPKKKNYVTDKALNKLIPEFDREKYATQEEKFAVASAYVMERLGSSALLNPIEKAETEDIAKYMMLFLADPGKAKKHFSVQDAWKKHYPDGAYAKNMAGYRENNPSPTESNEANKDKVEGTSIWGNELKMAAVAGGALLSTDLSETSAPQRKKVATEMYELIMRDKLTPVGYAYDNWERPEEAAELDDDNKVDCSGMVCALFDQAGFTNTARTSRGLFQSYTDRTVLMENQEDTNLATNLGAIKSGDLMYWNHTSEYTRKSGRKVPQLTEGSETYNIHHVAMVLDSNPEAGTITILETNGSEGTAVNIIDVKKELTKKNDQLIVSRMPYDS